MSTVVEVNTRQNPAYVEIPDSGGGAGPETVTGNEAIGAGQLIKVSASVALRYEVLLASDDPQLMVGVAVTACSGAGATFSAQFVPGTVTSGISDGTAIIPTGEPVTPSDSVDGAVMLCTDDMNICGINVGADVPATQGSAVSFR